MQKKLNKKLDLNEELSYLPETIVLTKENDELSSASSFSQLYLVILHWLKSKLRPTNIYVPFAYLEKVKRQGENYTLKIIFCDDIPILLLAFSWGNSSFIVHGASLIFLLISFWCIYELGYYENDCIAERYEEKPKLSSTYYAYKQMMNTSYPWLWSLVFGWIGIVLLEQTQGIYLPFKGLLLEQKTNSLEPIILFFLSWIMFLVCVKYCFSIYNYFNKQTRTWLYIVLQSIRYYGLLWVTSSSLIGVSFLSSHILSRSLLYIVYRYSGGNSVNWPSEIPEQLLRCSIFIFMLITICFGSQSLEIWQSGQTWIILGWCIVRGQSQIKKVLAQVKLVSQDGSN